MNTHLRFLLISSVFLIFSLLVSAQDNSAYIEITNDEPIEVFVGDTVDVNAVYVDTNSVEYDTTFTWTVYPPSLGTIDSTGQFFAAGIGEGFIYAEFEGLTDSIEVEVMEPDDDGDEFPYLLVVPEEAELSVGDSFQFQAVFVYGEDSQIDTTVVWSVSNDSLASIDSTGLLTALNPGDLEVTASLDSLLGVAEVEIEDSTDDDGDGDDHNKINVKPKESVVYVGETIQFTAHYEEDTTNTADSNIVWSLEGMPVGSIDQDGLFSADSTGFTLVYATLDEDTYGSAFVLVIDSTDGSEELNNITITKDRGNGHGPNDYIIVESLNEGEVWTLGGLPHPMNFLNGGKVYFPVGSLTEDVRIHMDIPHFGHNNDTTDFGAPGVISAVNFQVFVGDSIVEPYYFETPLIVGLVFKRGLLKKLNIDPMTVALYFTYNSADSVQFDSTGVNYTTIDLHRNRIYSTVAHFSTLTAKGKEYSVTGIKDNKPNELPTNFELLQNYPNPFNPSTTIKYNLPKDAKVKVVVYDILGKEVTTLINNIEKAGQKSVTWNGTNSNGMRVSSGIYFYQLQTDKFIKTRKMMLIK